MLALDGVIRPASLVAEQATARQLRGDLDAIIAKALRKAPGERYATAQALQEDLLRYLNREPVHARRGAALYRVRKFVARNRVAAVAALAIVASLSIGLFVANRERVKAEQRFDQVRQLSNKLFDIDTAVRELPGSVTARQLIVETSLEYLGRLADDARAIPSSRSISAPPTCAWRACKASLSARTSVRWTRRTRHSKRPQRSSIQYSPHSRRIDSPIYVARRSCMTA